MKKIKITICLMVLIFLLQSCATIVGGSRYIAHVEVKDHPKAIIRQEGLHKGTGIATLKIKRSDANKLQFAIKEDDCDEQIFEYKNRVFRGWSLVGTIISWTGTVVPIPWGVILDAATGAWWKPDVDENGIFKKNYKNYQYIINYTGCENKKRELKNVSIKESKADRLRDLKELLDENIITQEEFNKEKAKILDE